MIQKVSVVALYWRLNILTSSYCSVHVEVGTGHLDLLHVTESIVTLAIQLYRG